MNLYEYFINPSNVIDTLFEHSAYSLFTGIITFYSIVNNSENIILTLFHLLFYATLFGYLEHKIKVYDLSSRFKINWDSNNLFYNLISDNPVLISLTYKHNIIILSLSLFILSNHINYELYSLTDIALLILDTMYLLNIVFSYIITFICLNSLLFILKRIIGILPNNTRLLIVKLDSICTSMEQHLAQNRLEFALNIDDEYNSEYLNSKVNKGQIPYLYNIYFIEELCDTNILKIKERLRDL